MRKTLAFLALASAALAVVAYAQKVTPTPVLVTPVNAWTAAQGAVFDGGLSVGAAGTLGADTLGALECQARFAALGADVARSPVFRVLDDNTYRVIGLAVETVALDGGYQEISFNQTPLSTARFWRPLAGGDAGLQWFYQGSFSTTGSGGPTARSVQVVSMAGSFSHAPGYWCYVPLATGAGVELVWQRINVVRVPLANPR